MMSILSYKTRRNKVNGLRFDIWGFSLLIIILTIIAYRQYLFGNMLFVFQNSDSVTQLYPYNLYYARRILAGEFGATYNFAEGFGRYSGGIIPSLYNWICYFGEENVAYLMGVSQVIKVCLSGIFAYLFARERHGSNFICTIVGLAYAYCGHMIYRQEFNSYSVEVLVIIIWFFVYEYSCNHNKTWSIPIVTWFTLYYCGIVDLILWICTFIAYIVFREVTEESNQICWKRIFINELVLLLTILITYRTYLFNIIVDGMTSDRFVETTSGTTTQITNGIVSSEEASGWLTGVAGWVSGLFEKPYGILAYILRTVGMSINGSGDRYSGGLFSHLVDGGFYCGIITVIIIPYAIYKMRSKKRIIFILAYLVTGIYIMIPSLRFFLNGYGCPGYRFSALRITLFMILTLIEGLKCIEKRENIGKNDNVIIIGMWLLVTFVMLYALYTGKVVMFQYWLLSELLLTLYTVGLIIYINNWCGVRNFTISFTILMLIEAFLVPYDYINGRDTVLKQGYLEQYKDNMSEATGYRDASAKAVEYVKQIDNGWYRIDKDTVGYCDALAEDFNGIKAYIGGFGIGDSFKEICDKLALNMRGTDLFFGPLGDVYTQSLFGVKYVISENKDISTYGLVYEDNIDGTNIYRNDLALPVAYVYDTSIHEEELLSLSDMDRHKALLKACVVEDGKQLIGEFESNNLSGEFINSSDELIVSDDNVLIVGVNAPGKDVAYIDIENEKGETVRKGTRCRNGKYVFVEHIGYASNISTSIAYPYEELDNSNLEYIYYATDKDSYYEDSVMDIRKLQANGISVTEYDDYNIKGTISADSDGILATSIPYDSPWLIKIDGVEAEKQLINLYFMGTDIKEGEHEIEFYYTSNNSQWRQLKGTIELIIKLLVVGLLFEAIRRVLSVMEVKRGTYNE